jgi:lipoyl(octanoyl) transferase
MGDVQIIRAGLLPYEQAWQMQRNLHAARADDAGPDVVLLLEHPSVYTAGKRTEPHERPFDGTPVIDVDRGGKITWHGPGQLVGYPIIRLADPIDVVAYVRSLEVMMIAVCAEFGVTATQVEGRSGIWIVPPVTAVPAPDRKLGAIGIRVAQGVTLHGFALNANPDLARFQNIVACGIPDVVTTSLSAEAGREITVTEIIPVVERYVPALVAANTATRVAA